MQTFDTYGFYLISPGFDNMERFFEIKAYVEEICSTSEKIAQKYNKDYFCHFIPISKILSITCSVHNKKAKFGLYNHETQTLYNTSSIENLKLFTDLHKKQLIYRMEGAAKNNLNLAPIDRLWIEQINTKENIIIDDIIKD